jgi:hypothetical protein
MSVLVKNDSGEEIPAYAVMMATGVERLSNNRVAIKVDAFDPDADIEGPPIILVNGPTPLGITGSKRYGCARLADITPGWVAYDTEDGPPAFGEEWGLEDGEWRLKKDSDEQVFQIIGLPDAEKEIVLAAFILEGGEECPNNFRVIVVGNPTTGTFDLTLVLPGGSDTLTLNWDDTAGELETAIEGHAHWDANYSVAAADGPFPMNSISIQLGGGLAGTVVALPSASNVLLSGGARSGVRIERACCEEAV